MENDDEDIELYGDSNSDEIARKIFKTLKIIAITIFIFLVTYSKSFYVKEERSKSEFKAICKTLFFIKNNLSYGFYDEIPIESSDRKTLIENKEIKIKNIQVTKTNILGKTSIILNDSNLVNNSDNVYFDTIPFFTESIKIKVEYLHDDKTITSNYTFKPYFEFGVHRFWSWYDMFIYGTPLPLIKIGELN